jgi:hypothetical protein
MIQGSEMENSNYQYSYRLMLWKTSLPLTPVHLAINRYMLGGIA